MAGGGDARNNAPEVQGARSQGKKRWLDRARDELDRINAISATKYELIPDTPLVNKYSIRVFRYDLNGHLRLASEITPKRAWEALFNIREVLASEAAAREEKAATTEARAEL